MFADMLLKQTPNKASEILQSYIMIFLQAIKSPFCGVCMAAKKGTMDFCGIQRGMNYNAADK